MVVIAPSSVKARAGEAGFTLIEMLIVIAIVAVMSTVLLFNFSTFSTSIGVSNLAEQIGLSIRQAQSYATSVRRLDGTADLTSDTFPAYGISFSVNQTGIHEYDPTTTNFTLFADAAPNAATGDNTTDNLFGNNGVCGSPTGDGTQECLENFGLTGGNTIVSLCTDAPVPNSCFTPNGTAGTVNVVFHRPNPDAVICVVDAAGDSCIDQLASYLTITIASPKDALRTVTVWNTGQISIN